MALHLRAGESFSGGARRVIRGEIDKTLRGLSRSHSNQRNAVHDARKCFKKMRAILRLVRNELGARAYHRENACVRDAARPLTELRDATVLLDSLNELVDHSAPRISVKTIRRIHKTLCAHRAAVQKQAREGVGILGNVRATLKSARSRIRRLDVHARPWSAALGGLKRVYRQGRRACGAAIANPTTENLHEWRKQAKYLWYQLRLLEVIRPKAMKALARRVHELTQRLGDDHDLAMLRQELVTERDTLDDSDAMDSLFKAIDSRRDQLQRRAIGLGKRIYRRKPSALKRQIKRYCTNMTRGH